jgi:APA family basic amino acid/polyamine antiporter
LAGLLNASGVRVGAVSQRALSAAKVVALLVLVLAALAGAAAAPGQAGAPGTEPLPIGSSAADPAAHAVPGTVPAPAPAPAPVPAPVPAPAPAPDTPSPPSPPALPALPALAAMLGALAVVLWTYDGWSDVTLIAGELREPARHLGRTVLAGLATLAGLYVLVQLAVSVLLPGGAAAAADGVVAAAVAAGLGPRAGGLVAALVMVSTFGAINGVVLGASRIGYAMARAGVFPSAFGVVREGSGTPARSVIGLTLACLAYALWSDLIGLISLFTFAVWIFYALTAVALIRLRRRGVGEPLAWRAPGSWLPPVVVMATAVLMTASQVGSDWKRAAIGAALLLLAVPAWLVVREWRDVEGGR